MDSILFVHLPLDSNYQWMVHVRVDLHFDRPVVYLLASTLLVVWWQNETHIHGSLEIVLFVSADKTWSPYMLGCWQVSFIIIFFYCFEFTAIADVHFVYPASCQRTINEIDPDRYCVQLNELQNINNTEK